MILFFFILFYNIKYFFYSLLKKLQIMYFNYINIFNNFLLLLFKNNNILCINLYKKIKTLINNPVNLGQIFINR